ncbi:Reticulon-like protein B21, partial [Cucurbita argyrosperma subsp. argyrosperma]
MDLSRRRAGVARGNVVAGSVWESRIRFDEVRGGIRVFNGDDETAECRVPAATVGSARRKTWKSDEGFNSIQIAEEKPESPSSGDEQNRKTPIPSRRLRSNNSPNKPKLNEEENRSSRKSAVGIIKPPTNTNGIRKISPEKTVSSPPPQDFFDAFEEIKKESFDVKEINFPAQEIFPGNKQKLQRLMDLIMWREFSRSAMAFGAGNLVIALSYFIKNMNISFISMISHMGFVPLVNELLQNLKPLFHGDPSATMKMGVLLFVLAKWGSFITFWNILQCGFVAVFTLPKLFTHGEHWLRLCGSSWQLSSHKKGMIVAIFLMVWNFSSILYRVWAAFIAFVSFRYYRESLGRYGWVKNGEAARHNDTASGKFKA